MAKLTTEAKNLPILIGIPAVIILVMWFISGGMHLPEGKVDFGYFFGHWDFKYLSKNVFFIDVIMLSAAGLALYSAYKGISTMWGKMAEQLECNQDFKPSCKQFTLDFLWPSIQEIISHKRFNECGANKDRAKGHQPLMLAFIGLLLLTGYSFTIPSIV